MTLQEIYNTVLFGLRAQGRASTATDARGYTNCSYRSHDGAKCAAGLLIKDEHYSTKLEDKTVFSDEVQKALGASGVPCDFDSTALLIACQKAHDYPLRDEGLPAWEQRMARIAKDMHLVYTKLEAV